MLAQNRDMGGLSPLFLACPLRQRHFNFPFSTGKKAYINSCQHSHAGVWERETNSRYHNLTYQIPNHF
jgi:hypothetical protein